MRVNLGKPKNPKVLSEEETTERKAKRAKAEESRILEQLLNVMAGVGWSSDKVLARYFDVSRQRIWAWTKEGKLPAPHKHGEATTRWKNSEVSAAEDKNFLLGASND